MKIRKTKKKIISLLSFSIAVVILLASSSVLTSADEPTIPELPVETITPSQTTQEEVVIGSFSGEIPYPNINDQYHNEALIENMRSAGGASTYAVSLGGEKVPNGVYAFKNLGNTDRWMDVEQNQVTPGYHMQQYAFGSSPADIDSESGLFIVKAVDTNRYTIRLFINPELTFCISGTEVLTKEIPENDDDVAIEDTFYIYNYNGYCTIRPYNSNYYICANNTQASGMSGAPDSYLTRKFLSSAGDCAKWTFEIYNDYVVDGVYAFKNLGNTDRWMDIEQDNYKPGYHMQQYAFGSSPVESVSRSGLYKVTKVEGAERYVIRSMLNNCMTFGFDGNEVITKIIPPDDSDVSASDTFYISYNNGGYTLKPYGTSYYVCANNTQASGMAGAPDSYLAKKTLSSAGDNARWEMEQLVGSRIWGYELYFSDSSKTEFIAGESTGVKIAAWAAILGANEPKLVIGDAFDDIATSSWDVSNLEATVYTHDEGDFDITIKYLKNGSNILSSSTCESFTAGLPMTEGTYFFKNRKLGNYIQLDDNAAPEYSEDTKLELWTFQGESRERWTLIHATDGYYQIKSNENNLCFTVNSGEDNSENVNIVQKSYDGLSSQQWKFEKKDDGYYIIRARSAEDSDKDLCLAAAFSVLTDPDHRNVQQREYTDNEEYKDEWFVAQIGYISDVEYERQINTEWCWAATARMFTKHYKGNITYSQSDAVEHVKGVLINVGGTKLEAQSAINYYCSNLSGNQLNTIISGTDVYSADTLIRFLDDENVIYISRSKYTSLSDVNSREQGHASLLCGYAISNGSSWFLLKDPWDRDGAERMKWISYEMLYAGDNPQMFEKEDTWVWTGCIVVDTDYDQNTIPYYFG